MQVVLEQTARRLIDNRDAAHDFGHAHRVMRNAMLIGEAEGGDQDVLVPAALFHDVVIYPKDDPRSSNAARESASKAAEILESLSEYPQTKITRVIEAITHCSFSQDSVDLSLDAYILQDADRLEATGTIAIMRTFWSAGQMGQPLYHPADPYAEQREPDGLSYALDLFWTRLLRVEERMNTQTGRALAARRSKYLRSFVEQFGLELGR